MTCPFCTADLPDDDVFCEECGERIAPAAVRLPSCTCGAAASSIDEDGYCGVCGRRVRRAASDREEFELSPICAAVSDRGLQHPRNEDRFAIRQISSGYVLVVCDGVSSAADSDRASSIAARGVCDSLSRIISTADASPSDAMQTAFSEVEAEIATLSVDPRGGDPPSTTLVAAIVSDSIATIGWVGDSRAYWISNSDSRQLTADHSWLNDVVSAGEMSYDDAIKSPKAHAITRWLGIDAGENSTIDVAEFSMPGPGWLLLCTDGLWNYSPEPSGLTELIHSAERDSPDTLSISRKLVDFAIAQGGHDNITVVLLRVETTEGETCLAPTTHA